MKWIVFPILLISLGYSAWGLARLCPSIPALRWAVGTVWLLCFVTFLLSFIFRQYLSISLSSCLYNFVTSWLIIFIYVVMGLVLIDLLRFIPAIRESLIGSWGLMAGFVIALSLVFIYGRAKYHDKVRVPLKITLDKKIKNPLKIVAISDLHLGYTIREEELSSWVELINNEKPDLVLIAGDIVDGDVRPLLAGRFAETINLIEAPIYAALGNHEYIGGEDDVQSFLSRTKICLLRDNCALYDDQVYIVGRDDRTNIRRQSLEQLLKDIDTSRPIIVLDHQPNQLKESQVSGVDLQLSGHTHRGQVFPINLIVDQMFELSHGYKRDGKTHYYVSSGIGIWGGKFRLGTQSEYVVITIDSKTE